MTSSNIPPPQDSAGVPQQRPARLPKSHLISHGPNEALRGGLHRRLCKRLAALHQGPRAPTAALEVQDLSMLLLGLHTGLRWMNLVTLRLGQLRDQDGCFVIHLDAAETKNARPVDITLAPALTSMLRTYIDDWRPILVDAQAGDAALWPSTEDDLQAAPEDVSIARPLTPKLLDHTNGRLTLCLLMRVRRRQQISTTSQAAAPRGPSKPPR